MDITETRNIGTNKADSNYYKCTYCSFKLPKKNYNYLTHSCFANIDTSKEDIFIDNLNGLFRGAIHTVVTDDVNSENVESCSSVAKKKTRNKEDKTWTDYDELLINAVMTRPCLWNHTIPVKKRSSLTIKDAWLEVKKELEDKFEVEILKKRWSHLRDSYKKARNKMTEYIPSGSASIMEKNSGFRYYYQMEFLNDCMISRPSTSNISVDPLDDNNEANNSERLLENEEDNDENLLEINSSVSNFTSFSEHTKRK